MSLNDQHSVQGLGGLEGYAADGAHHSLFHGRPAGICLLRLLCRTVPYAIPHCISSHRMEVVPCSRHRHRKVASFFCSEILREKKGPAAGTSKSTLVRTDRFQPVYERRGFARNYPTILRGSTRVWSLTQEGGDRRQKCFPLTKRSHLEVFVFVRFLSPSSISSPDFSLSALPNPFPFIASYFVP